MSLWHIASFNVIAKIYRFIQSITLSLLHIIYKGVSWRAYDLVSEPTHNLLYSYSHLSYHFPKMESEGFRKVGQFLQIITTSKFPKKPKSFEPWWGQLCNACTNECILEHLCIWGCTLKLDQEKSKHAGLAEHNCKILQWLVKCAETLCTCRKECRKYDSTGAQWFWLAHHTDWCTWFAISSHPPICCSSFSFMMGL
jgi:hypothetical protein